MKLICTRCNRSKYALGASNQRCECGGTFSAIQDMLDDFDRFGGQDTDDPKELEFTGA